MSERDVTQRRELVRLPRKNGDELVVNAVTLSRGGNAAEIGVIGDLRNHPEGKRRGFKYRVLLLHSEARAVVDALARHGGER